MAKQNAIKFDHRAFERLTPIRFAMFSHTRHFARAATRLAASFISNEARYVAFWHETDLLGGSGHVWSRGDQTDMARTGCNFRDPARKCDPDKQPKRESIARNPLN
jgi:hypothetical protein